jgi:hypothetical protein
VKIYHSTKSLGDRKESKLSNLAVRTSYLLVRNPIVRNDQDADNNCSTSGDEAWCYMSGHLMEHENTKITLRYPLSYSKQVFSLERTL